MFIKILMSSVLHTYLQYSHHFSQTS